MNFAKPSVLSDALKTVPTNGSLLSSALEPSTTSAFTPANSWNGASGASAIAFIDGSVADYQTLVAGIAPGTEVHILNSSQDAVTQITNTLLGRHNISSLHIVSHGEAGGMDFGTGKLNLSDLPEYAAQLQSWGKALTDDADILLYGCNVAQGELGKAFTSILSQLTGADVAASNDLTGGSAQGGNWTLEVNTGQIAATLAFQASVLSNYQPVLAVDLISRADPTIPNDTASGNISPGSISSDGRYVAFTSGRDNLVTNDANNTQDVFVLDRQTGTTTLISTTGTTSGNSSSYSPVLSADGRYVAFGSSASNLVANDSNGTQDVFVRDLLNGTTTLVSTTGTTSGNNYSSSPVVSADGRYVAFTSNASNLVANDSNNTQDVFVRDLVSGTTTLVSTTGTTSGNNYSSSPVLSADGRYVAFTSSASNLVANDSNNTQDVFVRDLVSGTTTLVSTTGTTGGNNYSYNPVLSADGRYVAFTSQSSNLVANDTNGTQDVFVRDLVSGTTTLVSTTGTTSGNNYSDNPVLSADGRYVAFTSQSSNLVANDSNGTTEDVFVRDLLNGTTTLVSTTGTTSGNNYSYNPVLSADGRYVAFTSQSSNLVANDSNGTTQDVFVRDLLNGTTTLVSTTGTTSGNSDSYNPVLSADGRYVAFGSNASNLVANDGNNTQDVFLYDRTASSTTLVSRRVPSLPSLSGNSSSTANGNQSLSADGRYVAFTSNASNLVANDSNNTQDVFLLDRQTGTTTLVSTTGTTSGNNYSYSPVVSADGRYVAFTSNASNLVANDSNGTIQDVFVRDLVSGTTTLVSTTGTTSGNNYSSSPVLSADGRYVAFTSQSSNLVANDSNGTTQDVFVRDLLNGTTTLVSTTGTTSGNSDSYNPVLSADGRYVAFTSSASNLVANDSNNTQDVFVRDLVSGTTTLVSTTGTTGGNNYSYNPVLSADGRYVAFTSQSSNLVANDTNGTQDVFVRDLVSGTTTLVSTTGTTSGNNYSDNPVLSADGRYVAFTSQSSNLVANDSNGTTQDVFVRDLLNGTTTLVSTTGTTSGNNYSYNPVLSADGRYVAFTSQSSNLVANDSNGTTQDVFVRNLLNGTTTLVSTTGTTSGNSDSYSPVLSADGRYVAFTSNASNLVIGDYNGAYDVFGSVLNALPTSTNSSFAFNEDTVYTFRPTDFAFADTDGGTFTSVKITQLPTVGQLFLDNNSDNLQGTGEAIAANQVLVVADLGKLKFKPAADANGTNYASFQFQVNDGTSFSTSYTATLNVNAVNDVPSFIKGGDYTITAGANVQTIPSWATGFNPGPNEASQTVQAYLVNVDTNPGIFAVAPAIDTFGNLTYTPAANVATPTTAMISVKVQDNGGTANSGTDTSAVQTFAITVKPQPTIAIMPVSQNEGNSSTAAYTFTVSLSDTSTQTVSVNYATADSTATVADGDYSATSGTLTFAPGETSKTFTVNANGDTKYETTEAFLVNLSNAVNGAIAPGSTSVNGTIKNDDTIPVANITPTITQVEGNSSTTPYTFTVTLSNPSFEAIGINYSTSDGSATVADGDYTAATGIVNFAPGETSKTITVNANGDTKFESDESFQLALTGPANGSGSVSPGNTITGIGTITNDDTQPTIGISSVGQNEGNSGTTSYTFTVSLSNASAQTVSVNYATADGTATVTDSDYVAASGTLSFAPGQTSKSITVLVNGDTKFEADQTFSVVLSNASNGTLGTSTGTGTITNDDSRPTISINNISHIEGATGTTAYTFTVNLSNTSDESVTVNYATADGTATVANSDYTATSGTLTFNPTETSKTLTVNANGDTRKEANETFQVTLAAPVNRTIATGTGTGTIVNDDNVNLVWRSGTTGTSPTGTGEVAIWQLNGFTYQSGYYLPTLADLNWQIVSRADFNHDGNTDLLWRNRTTGVNAIWETNNFTLKSSYYIPGISDLNWQVVNTADFNGDSKPDILWRNRTTGENAVWQLNGSTLQSGYYISTLADPNWQIADTADFNNDGTADILWRNRVTGENAIWQISNFSRQSAYYIPNLKDQNWQIAGTGDFNHDGIADIVWRNKDTGSNAIWQMNSTGFQSGYYIPTAAATSWQVAGIADFDGDGTADILWRNQQSGKEEIWQMSGFSYSQTYQLPDVSRDWIVQTLPLP